MELKMELKDVRKPVRAGDFYPSDPIVLRRLVQHYLDAAEISSANRTCAVIAPHAGYLYSGPVAAYAFKALQACSPAPTVYLMGPAHYSRMHVVAVGPYAAWQTPLGKVPADRLALQTLLAYGYPFEAIAAAHEAEHCLEVELPFLQIRLGEFSIVPLLFGDVDPVEVASDLGRLLPANALIVVSSDLSHYYDYDTARRRDRAMIAAILEGDLEKVASGEACGLEAIRTLAVLAQAKGWHPHLLAYCNSGDTRGNPDNVVGYAAIAYKEQPQAGSG